MQRRSRSSGPTAGRTTAVYSIWNAPPEEWILPFDVGAVEGIEAAVRELPARSVRENDNVVAFRTPVTPDVLRLPTQG